MQLQLVVYQKRVVFSFHLQEIEGNWPKNDEGMDGHFSPPT